MASVLPSLRQDLLQNILNVARTSLNAIPSPRPVLPFYSSALPELHLQLPDNVKAELNDTSVPIELRTALTAVLADLQAQYHHSYQQVYQQSLTVPMPQLNGLDKLEYSLQLLFTTQTLPDLMSRYTEAKQVRADRIARQLEARRLAEERDRPQFNAVRLALRIPPYPLLTRLPRTTHLSSQ